MHESDTVLNSLACFFMLKCHLIMTILHLCKPVGSAATTNCM